MRIRVEGQFDVHRRQKGKDVGLQEDDQELEQAECKSQNNGQTRQCRPTVQLPEEEVRSREQEDQNDVSSQEVRHETNGEGNWSQNEGREELDRHNEQVQDRRKVRNNHRGLNKLAETVALCTGVNHCDVRNRCKNDRHTDTTIRRDVKSRDDGRYVHKQDCEEDRRDNREESLRLLLTQDVFGDVDADKIDRMLADILQTLWNQLGVLKGQHEKNHQYQRHQDAHQH